MPTYKAPGVYIEEIPATGPIAGVGTSTAAFIGPALQGPIGVPTKITNWSQFKDNFGEYIATPRQYMAYAVEAFFRNGGTVAYITRVGTAARASRQLDDRDGGIALDVEALTEGTAGNSITVQVQNAQIVAGATAVRAAATVAAAPVSQNDTIHVTDANDAAAFRPGDEILIGAERVTIRRISGTQIQLESNLAGNFNAGTVRIANLVANQRSFRIAGAAGLEVGSVIQISQGATQENAVVAGLAADFVTLAQGLNNAYTMAAGDAAVQMSSFEFNLIVRGPGSPDETFGNLSMDSRHSRYFAKIVDSSMVSVRLPAAPSTAVPPDDRPAVLAASPLTGGTADNLASIGANHYTSGLDALVRVDDVNIVAIPDRQDQTVQQALIAHCESMADRFAILDSGRNLEPFGVGSVTEQRSALESTNGYAALYYPWLEISDPQGTNGASILVPPSGHMAGIYARSDEQFGVHKAPANELITGALRLERKVTEGELGELNIAGINLLRTFPNRARPIVWGARTTVPPAETAWRYVNVRRLLLYIEESIEEGIQWSVFQPNNLALWQKLIRTISEFLNRVWQSGALFGATADQAYYVKCDEELNPASVRALGQVYVEIGVAPVRPAEFVIVRIGQWEGGSEVSEG